MGLIIEHIISGKDLPPSASGSASLKPHVEGSPYAACHARISASHTYKVVMAAVQEAEQQKKPTNDALMDVGIIFRMVVRA